MRTALAASTKACFDAVHNLTLHPDINRYRHIVHSPVLQGGLEDSAASQMQHPVEYKIVYVCVYICVEIQKLEQVAYFA